MIYRSLQDLISSFNRYHLLVADPPWEFANANFRRNCGRREKANYHYETGMTLKEIMALPVPEIAMPVSGMVLWTTDAHLLFAGECLKHWGYKYSTVVFNWVKLKNGKPVKNLGPWTMKSAELALLGTSPGFWSNYLKTQSEPQLIMGERGRHSEKPSEAYERLERMFPDALKIDLFARKTRQGWDSFGNEVAECSND